MCVRVCVYTQTRFRAVDRSVFNPEYQT
uniref:Uncharacterized protein n=1 Tax=Anguilla anguilla TaxID=7936 RepID=A0A0E9UNQ8_ANGAN